MIEDDESTEIDSSFHQGDTDSTCDGDKLRIKYVRL